MRFIITHIHSISPEDLMAIARCGKPLFLSGAGSDNLDIGDKMRLQTNPRNEGNGDMIVEFRIKKIIELENGYREIYFGMEDGLDNL